MSKAQAPIVAAARIASLCHALHCLSASRLARNGRNLAEDFEKSINEDVEPITTSICNLCTNDQIGPRG